MKLQILSHAGLRINAAGAELLCDPWLIGSCYWRAWWNFPPVKQATIDSLAPTAIYLTHIHWDHFQGPSLKLFSKETLLLVPSGNYDRIKRDLNSMGYKNVVELNHGQSYQLADNFKITSYHFGPFLDSAVVIEAEDTVIFNANDAKFMGLPLKQIIRNHPKIDFVLRSHSSANSRLCYEYMDDPKKAVDDIDQYIKNFADFCRSTGARYAVPFASNHCFLHKEVIGFNNTIQTPYMVQEYFQRKGIVSPELKIMVSGDSWSSDAGFDISEHDYFADREGQLLRYRDEVSEKLEQSYLKEEKTKIRLGAVEKYFANFSQSIPWVLRKSLFKGVEYLYVLTAGENITRIAVNVGTGAVREIEGSIEAFDIQIHTSAMIFQQCIALDLFSHLAISKRVVYKVTRRSQKKMALLNLMFNFYEYEIFPLSNNFSARFFSNWARRWRELFLYASLVFDYVLTRRFDQAKYLSIGHGLPAVGNKV
ncbi:MAG TPA: hypothetical protein VLC91_03365 [Spongiibacteraceae bacterium]|nr:hypothetical protein [Spongiibacteraceae bacterium]